MPDAGLKITCHRYYTRPIDGVYSNERKSHSKSLRDGIFVVKLGFFAKNVRKTPRISCRSENNLPSLFDIYFILTAVPQ